MSKRGNEMTYKACCYMNRTLFFDNIALSEVCNLNEDRCLSEIFYSACDAAKKIILLSLTKKNLLKIFKRKKMLLSTKKNII